MIGNLIVSVLGFAIVIGGIGFAIWYLLIRDVPWCEANRSGLDVTERETQNIIEYAGDCNSSQCNARKDAFNQVYVPHTLDIFYWENKDNETITRECREMCDLLYLALECECKVCNKCHADCGMEKQALCQKAMVCGPDHHKVYEGI
jgi:hypothetical protein